MKWYIKQDSNEDLSIGKIYIFNWSYIWLFWWYIILSEDDYFDDIFDTFDIFNLIDENLFIMNLSPPNGLEMVTKIN